MPPAAYFLGKILLVLAITTAQLAVMLALVLASRFHEAGCPAGGQGSRKCL
jgi:hypothetical protein